MNSPSRSAVSIIARCIALGDERAWWQAAGIDPSQVARKLWSVTRIAEGRIEAGRTPPRAAAARSEFRPWRLRRQTPAPA